MNILRLGEESVFLMFLIWANSGYWPFLFEISQYITSNNVSVLFDGRFSILCFPNGKGGIVDDLLVYRYNYEKFLLVVNAAILKKTGTGVSECRKVRTETR